MNAEEMRAALLAADDLDREPAKDVPEAWTAVLEGRELYAQALPLAAWKPWLNRDGEFQMSPESITSIVVQGLVTEDGQAIFRRGDAAKLAGKNGRGLLNLCKQIMVLSDLSAEDQEEVRESFDGAQPGDT